MKTITQYILLFCLLSTICLKAQAQALPDVAGLLILPSPQGNYLVIAPMKPTAADSVLMQETAYFQVERVELTPRLLERGQGRVEKRGVGSNEPDQTTLKTREIAQFRRPNTVQELRKLVSVDYLNALKKATKQATDEELLRYIQTHTSPDSYGLMGSSIDLQPLLGTVYVDAEVSAGSVYFYRIFRVDKANQRKPWSEGTTVAGVENPMLKALQVRATQVVGRDSLVAMTWALPVSQFVASVKPVVPSSPVSLTDLAFVKSLVTHVTSAESVKGALMLYNGIEWKQAQTLIPTLNAKGDSLLFYWTKPCLPEEVVRACIVPLDIVKNLGTPSDTITAVAVRKQDLIYIYSAQARDTTDAIRVSWAKLPVKPYYTGVEIMRDNGTDSTFSVVAQLTPRDSVFLDYQVRPGVNYTYRARPIFIPLQGLEQPVPAETVGSCTKFNKPLPVSDLQISQDGPHVRLNWRSTDTPSLFGHYVYRGTSKDNLSLVSGAIRKGTNTYLDSSDVLSGRSEYFYSVMSMNLTQDTSTLAPPVGIRPLRPIETTYPKIVEVSLVNKAAWLSWNDVRQQDNILTGFVLQKRTQPTGPFSPLSTTALTEPSFIDTTLQAGQTVWYRVAALTTFGDTTAFSEPIELTIPRPAPEPVFIFYVRNVARGVEVSWPGASNGRREKYSIYRREAKSNEFAKVGEVGQRGTLYVDTQVQNGIKYVYSVTAIETGNRESNRVKSQAITRQ